MVGIPPAVTMSPVVEIPIFGGSEDGGVFTVTLDVAGQPPETVYQLLARSPRLLSPADVVNPGVDRVPYRRERFFNPWDPAAGARWRYTHPDVRL